MKYALLIVLSVSCALLCACGNDKEVEDAFVKQVDKATAVLKKAKSVNEILVAQDLLDKAYKIEGVEELSDRGATAESINRFEKELEIAQQRVMDNLSSQLADENVVFEDSIN